MQGLTACGLFHDLPPKELRAIEKLFSEVNHPAGHKVMAPGQEGIGFMVILDGEAEVKTVDGRERRLKAGDYFGEMALLDKQGRSAEVTAATSLRIAAIPGWSFKGFLTNHPEVMYRLLETVSNRLREVELA